MKQGRWSAEEDAFLTANHLKLTSSEIASALNRTITAVRHRAVRLGISIPPAIPPVDWSPEETEFLRTHYATMTTAELAAALSRGVRSIRKRAVRLNLEFPVLRLKGWIDPSKLPELTPIQLGYFAGIVDGEGTISIHKVYPKGREGQFRLQPLMSIAGTDVRLAEYLKATLQASHNTFFRPRKNRAHKPQFATGWYGYRCYPIIKLIEPYLLLKGEQARIVMAYIESRAQMSRHNRAYTQEQYALYEQIRDLNRK